MKVKKRTGFKNLEWCRTAQNPSTPRYPPPRYSALHLRSVMTAPRKQHPTGALLPQHPGNLRPASALQKNPPTSTVGRQRTASAKKSPACALSRLQVHLYPGMSRGIFLFYIKEACFFAHQQYYIFFYSRKHNAPVLPETVDYILN
jgi:hypothetical protein